MLRRSFRGILLLTSNVRWTALHIARLLVQLTSCSRIARSLSARFALGWHDDKRGSAWSSELRWLTFGETKLWICLHSQCFLRVSGKVICKRLRGFYGVLATKNFPILR